MTSQVNRYWRIFGTGLSFSLFGLGGFFLRILVFPILRLLLWKREVYTKSSRHIIRFSFKAFIGIMKGLGVLTVTLSGIERLNRQGLLIVANHPTLLDIVFLLSLVKHGDCIVKSKLLDNPFTRGPINAAGYIANQQESELCNDSIISLEKGSNLIIFPEGTRTPNDGVVRLERGMANIAIRGNYNITPIHIRCTPSALQKNTKWWQVPPKPMHFEIRVFEDIEIHSFIVKNKNPALAVRELTNFMQDFFNKENTNEQT